MWHQWSAETWMWKPQKIMNDKSTAQVWITCEMMLFHPSMHATEGTVIMKHLSLETTLYLFLFMCFIWCLSLSYYTLVSASIFLSPNIHQWQDVVLMTFFHLVCVFQSNDEQTAAGYVHQKVLRQQDSGAGGDLRERNNKGGGIFLLQLPRQYQALEQESEGRVM